MRFGERIRELRRNKGWRLRDFAERVGVGHTHLSRIENERLNYGEFPATPLIHRLAEALDTEALDAGVDELLLLSKRIPEAVRKRVLERPDAFLVFAVCDDATLDRLLSHASDRQLAKSRRAVT